MSTIYTTADDFNVNLGKIGALATAPASGTVSLIGKRIGEFFSLTFTFTAARITVTDAAGSGSSGSLKIFDFNEGVFQMLSNRHNWTAFAEGAGLTGAGDADFVIAFGTVAANAGDGVLTSTEVDLGATRAVTLVSGAGTGATTIGTTTASFDGSGTAIDLYMNWSGTATTIDATSTIDVTGTYTLTGVWLGDD